MKKLSVLFLALVAICIGITICHRATTLPTGGLMSASTSPNRDYTIQAYLCDDGETTDQAIRAEAMLAGLGMGS